MPELIMTDLVRLRRHSRPASQAREEGRVRADRGGLACQGLRDGLRVAEGSRCGIMEMEATAFDWTLRYDEVDYIIEGTLEILIDEQTVTGNQGDALYIPADSSITFRAPGFARFLYVTYPANWAAQ